jgi:hypothetical protein
VNEDLARKFQTENLEEESYFATGAKDSFQQNPVQKMTSIEDKFTEKLESGPNFFEQHVLKDTKLKHKKKNFTDIEGQPKTVKPELVALPIIHESKEAS